MTRVARQALNTQRPVERCALCARPIGPDAKVVPHIGKVGSTCAHRVAAIEQSLEKHDLTRFLESPVDFDAEPDEDAHSISRWVFPDHIQAVMQRAEKLGFQFLWGWTDERAGAARCWIVLPRNAERRRSVWTQLEKGYMVSA